MGAKSLCIPFNQPAQLADSDRCVRPGCDKKPQYYTLFGRSYWTAVKRAEGLLSRPRDDDGQPPPSPPPPHVWSAFLTCVLGFKLTLDQLLHLPDFSQHMLKKILLKAFWLKYNLFM